VANVQRVKANCGDTKAGLANLKSRWLGTTKWDVIHFNWGLHDLKYMNAKGALTDVDAGQQQVSPEDYEKNLDQLVRRLKQSGAKLIWCQTTPVPKGAKGRIPDDVLKYNAIATKVMQRHEVAIDDLYTFANERLQKIQKKADVHYTPEGSKVLAKQVADEIRKQLGK
ncbi:MAG: SGNH/GDSL hydrolase family protein, partial [Planctomycetaceae bacterium]|nr:SGNH/GDSL hydrolase family protein [Planctomycetaceae bacterium]